MTDLHVHILPGVDDGSPNLSTSLEMAEIAAQSGVRILAVTPHANQTGIEGVEDGYVNYESEQLEELFYRLEREINREHIPISLVRGMEIMSFAGSPKLTPCLPAWKPEAHPLYGSQEQRLWRLWASRACILAGRAPAMPEESFPPR